MISHDPLPPNTIDGPIIVGDAFDDSHNTDVITLAITQMITHEPTLASHITASATTYATTCTTIHKETHVATHVSHSGIYLELELIHNMISVVNGQLKHFFVVSWVSFKFNP